MKFTPLDIKKQEFKKTLRGYDPVEVDAFLEMVSDELENIFREKNHFSDEIIKLKTQLRDYQEIEKTLKDTLMSAQESIKDSRENSSREAEMMIREAELKSEKILADAKLTLAKMRNELVVVKAQKDSFARRLRHLLESQIDLIEVLDLDDLGFEKYTNESERQKPTPKNEQEKIEFRGIDLPEVEQKEEMSTDENSSVQEKPVEEPHNIHWKNRDIEVIEESMDEKNRSKASRISDNLIT